MIRDACAGCGGDVQPFLDLGSSPLADSFPATATEDEPRYPLVLQVCHACRLVQMRDVVPAAQLFGNDYAFMSGSSPALRSYFAAVAQSLMKLYPAASLVTEIACNDGTLLSHFSGCKTLGVEPAAPAAVAARSKGLEVVQELFTADLARTLPRAALVLAFNVAAHVENPLDFLTGIRLMLARHGTAIVEFQYLGDLIAGCQVDHVYHEHRFFYSASSFAALAADAGLAVMHIMHTPAQGGSLRVTLAHSGSPGPAFAEKWLEDPAVYLSLQGRADYMAHRLLELLAAERRAGRVVAGYGATAKSATLLNWAGIGTGLVQWIEDTTPGKIGRFSPGMKIPVVAPGNPPDTYLLLAWNYISSVLRREHAFTDRGGKFIVPGPVPVVL